MQSYVLDANTRVAGGIDMLTKDDLFQELCKMTATIPMGYAPKIYSIPFLTDHMNETKYLWDCIYDIEEREDITDDKQ